MSTYYQVTNIYSVIYIVKKTNICAQKRCKTENIYHNVICNHMFTDKLRERSQEKPYMNPHFNDIVYHGARDQKTFGGLTKVPPTW